VDWASCPTAASFRIDDEGTPPQRTVLVEDGVLTGYLWDPAQRAAHRNPADRQRPEIELPRVPAVPHDQHHIEPGPHDPAE